jgi:serine/threonine protein phosphatase PrpC
MKRSFLIKNDPLVIELTDCSFDYGHTSLQNTRETNEDSETIICKNGWSNLSFFGVYDGHGGNISSLFASQYLHKFLFEALEHTDNFQEALEEAHQKTNDSLYTLGTTSGSTTSVAIVDQQQRKIYAGNVGDSRVLLVRKNGKIYQMTRDHSSIFAGGESSLEIREMLKDIATIKSLGAILDEGYIMEPTLNNGINMTRSLGDFYIPGMKENSVPHMTSHSYSRGDILILACDGVWDSRWKIDNDWVRSKTMIEEENIPREIRMKLMKGEPITSREQSSIRMIRRPIRSNEPATNEIVGYYALEQRRNGVSAQELSRLIANKSLNSGDNITVIVVYL